MAPGYDFSGDFPTEGTTRQTCDDADFCRAHEARRSFLPAVAFSVTCKGKPAFGVDCDKGFALSKGSPAQAVSPSMPLDRRHPALAQKGGRNG